MSNHEDKNTLSNNKDIWVFGDSFATTTGDSDDWFSLLVKNFNGKNYFNHHCPSRDSQTIMDTFYANLHNIKEDSLVIIWLPSLARIRYPKNKKYYKVFEEQLFISNTESENLELFVHWPYQDFPNGTPKKELDFPFNKFDFNELNKEEMVSYFYYTDDGKEKINRAINEGISYVDFAKLLNANESTSKNWSMIIKSLQKFCKFDLIFLSWTDEYDKDVVFGKKDLEKNIGMWHTRHAHFLETNGKEGEEWDLHFSTKMHKKFAEWIIKKYPKYFNKILTF